MLNVCTNQTVHQDAGNAVGLADTPKIAGRNRRKIAALQIFAALKFVPDIVKSLASMV